MVFDPVADNDFADTAVGIRNNVNRFVLYIFIVVVFITEMIFSGSDEVPDSLFAPANTVAPTVPAVSNAQRHNAMIFFDDFFMIYYLA